MDRTARCSVSLKRPPADIALYSGCARFEHPTPPSASELLDMEKDLAGDFRAALFGRDGQAAQGVGNREMSESRAQ